MEDVIEGGAEKVCIPIAEYIIGDHTSDKISTKTRFDAQDGAFGEIWQACESGACKYILKYQKFRAENENTGTPAITKASIIREALLQNEFAKLKLAPKVKDSWLCDKGGVIVMPALKKTAYSLFGIYDDIEVYYLILASCLSLIRRLHEKGYYHGDATISNIMVNYSSSDMEDAEDEVEDMKKYKAMRYKYYFIDMGLSGRLDNEKDNKRLMDTDYQILAMSIQDKYDHATKTSFEKNFIGMIDFMSEYMREIN